MKKPTGVYFGTSLMMAETLSQAVDLVAIVNQPSRFEKSLYDLSVLKDVTFISAQTDRDLTHESLYADLGFSFSNGLIFTKNTIGKFAFGIINFHAGKLPSMRSRHPIGWALIENHSSIYVTAHLVDEEIDRGFKLMEKSISISVSDTEKTLAERAEAKICETMLKPSIELALSKQGTPIGKGRYLKSLHGQYETIDPKEFSAIELFNIMRAKAAYGGFRVGDKNYQECHIIYEPNVDSYDSYDFYTCKDEKRIALK